MIGKKVKSLRASKSALSSGLKVDVLGISSGVFIVRLVELGTGNIMVEQKILKLN